MVADHCELLCIDLDVAEALRKHRLSLNRAETAAGRARALADPTRLLLAAALSQADELCVCDLAWIAERSQNLVSHHLRALKTAGLVHSRREGKMVMYSLAEGAVVLVEAVLERAAVETT